jgi:hypothetical protein
MDGRVRATHVFFIMLSVSHLCFGAQAFAQSDAKSPPIDQRLYQSAVLTEEFIRSCEVVLRIDATGDSQSLGAELELLNMNSRKTRFFTVASVPLTLKQTSVDKNKSDRSRTITYNVAGIPSDMIKSDQNVTLKVTGSKGKETAELTVCNSDGETSRRIELSRVMPTNDSIAIKPEN